MVTVLQAFPHVNEGVRFVAAEEDGDAPHGFRPERELNGMMRIARRMTFAPSSNAAAILRSARMRAASRFPMSSTTAQIDMMTSDTRSSLGFTDTDSRLYRGLDRHLLHVALPKPA